MSNRNSNFDIFPREPGASERQARDALDDIDEAVARITDDDIENRLRETFRLAGYGPGQHASPEPDISTISPAPGTSLPGDAASARTRHAHACAACTEE